MGSANQALVSQVKELETSKQLAATLKAENHNLNVCIRQSSSAMFHIHIDIKVYISIYKSLNIYRKVILIFAIAVQEKLAALIQEKNAAEKVCGEISILLLNIYI
mgnify:CR=1 FL=1